MKVYGINFDIEKQGTQYRVHYHNSKVAVASTKKKAIAKAKRELYKRGKVVVRECCLSYLRSKIKNKRVEATRLPFKAMFGFELPLCRFMSMLGRKSIDVIGLDKMLRVPEGVSTREYIKSKYGDKASRLVADLI